MDPTVILTGVGTIVTTNIALIGWLRSDIKGFESELTRSPSDKQP